LVKRALKGAGKGLYKSDLLLISYLDLVDDLVKVLKAWKA
jgi:hypothetical protein